MVLKKKFIYEQQSSNETNNRKSQQDANDNPSNRSAGYTTALRVCISGDSQ
jgi:hypothetical protein